MCGIGGILRLWPAGTTPPPPHESIPESWLDSIDAAIKHRGPDGHGRFRDRATRPDGSTVDVALVHRRLAIIDPACGHQPMVSERGRTDAEGLVAVVFNGCIYNHRELRRELETKGHRFESDHSDTEVLIHGWREWKQGLFDRLVAMGALAIWDRAHAALVLHRTAPGEKPLYKTCNEPLNIYTFASVPRALRSLHTHFQPTPLHNSTESLVRWIALGHGNDLTPVPGVELLTYGTAETDSLETSDALGLADVEVSRLPGDDDPAPAPGIEFQLDNLLSRAVAERLEADVPICCLLSGGIDSSLIAHHAMRSAGSLRTLCVRMPDHRYDESPFAEAVAKQIGSTHTTIDAGADPANDLVHLITQLGLPFGDSSLLPTCWACRAASTHAKVLLTGDGGDELFYGYDRYAAASWALMTRDLARLVPLSLVPRRDPKGKGDRIARFLAAARKNSTTSLHAIFQHPDLERLLGGRANLMGWGVNFSGAQSARDEDLRYTLESDMLRKVDTASMAVPVETRAPFLDKGLIRAVRHLTPDVAMPGGERKHLLRKLARRYLPAEIADRPKQGFAVPIGEWFRSDYGGMRQLLMDHLNSAEPWPDIGLEINRRFVAQMVDEHMNHKRDHSQRLYMLLVLSVWARNCLK